MKKSVLLTAGGLLFIQGVFAQTNVFVADFESGTGANTGTITYGAGYSVQVAVTGGPDAALGSNVLFADPSTDGSAATDLTLTPENAVSLTSGQAAKVSLNFAIRRTNGSNKSHYVTGYDSGNNIIFRFVLGELNEFGNGGADRQRPGYAVSSGSYSFAAGQIASGTNPGSYWFGNDANPTDGLNAAKEAHFEITVSSGGWSLYTVKLDGTTTAQTATLPTWNGGNHAELAYVKVTGESASAGGYFDNLSIQSVTGPVIVPNSHDFYHNLAKYQSVKADSYASDKPVQYANDGLVSQDSRWVSTGAGPHWLEIELAVPMTIGSAHLFSGGTWDSPMSSFVLQYDNGGSWTDIEGTDISGNTLPERNLMFTAPVTAQKFRLYTTDGTARVEELALYPPTSDGSNVAYGVDVDLNNAKLRQYEYSSVDGANYPKLAFDGYADNSSAWASANAAGPHDLEIHLPQGEKIRGIQLYSGYEGVAGTQVQDFEVAYYDGGSSSWVAFAGGAVSNNTELNLNIWFDAAATSTKFRFRSLDANQAFIRELVLLPENNTGGYPLWTDVLDEAPPSQSFMDYQDSYYTIENRSTGHNLSTTTSGSFTTPNEPQFQVLLNLGTDTYRLRSKDSERCFEVSLASTNSGAEIIEGEYSSMPHQRWRLADTGDGIHFQIVNAWSGMVLGLDGTNAVQQTAGSEFSKHWKINYVTHFPKKGQASHFHFNTMYKPDWGYNWKYDGENLVDYGQYYPMQWGAMNSATAGILRYQPKWYGRANQTMVMGFNEPDHQSNIEEADAAYMWPRLERMRLPLLAPVPVGSNNSWRQNYEALAAERGLRSDYMTMHWYSTSGASSGSPSQLINKMQELYVAYGKPIMLTEFSTRDFDGDKTSWSRNHNYNFLAEFMWRAESLPWLKGWSVFEWGYGGDSATTDGNSENPTDMNSPKLALHYSNDASDPGWEDLMECGLLLAGWDGNDFLVDETAYIIHNKGRFLRLIDHPASNTVSYADVEHRQATEQFMLEAATGGRKYITGLSDGRRLSYNGSSVGLAAAGTTGSTVEWELNENQHGWFFIDHPSTGKRLRIMSNNVINVDNDTNTGDNLKFRFIRHYQPITVAEVQTLPYVESFEDGIGAWRQFYDDGRDWEIGSGGTPTAAAGPGKASDGDHYLFSEGHDAGSYVTNMVDCAFDLSTVSGAQMLFDYHMYGPQIDFLAIDIHDGSTWISNVWIKSGAQQTTNNAPWKTAVVDLSSYTGNNKVTIRFRTANKQWNAADPAIDDIRILESLKQSLPYAESFENGLGAWVQSEADDFNWTRGSGYTPTGGTGPSGASDGSQYLYIDPHDIYDGHNKMAQIECAFDFSSLDSAELSFDYHMYGVNIDYLAVDVHDGNTWTSDVWKKSGVQHASSEAAWSNAVVDLSAYVGNNDVTLRFRAKQFYWHVADIAIDHIVIDELDPYRQWAESAFAGAPPGTDASESGNPDGDRFTNLQEWALVLDPMAPDAPALDSAIDSSNFTVFYDRRTDSGLTVRAAWAASATAGTWRLDGDGMTESSVGMTNDVETMSATVPLDEGQKFIRLEVEE